MDAGAAPEGDFRVWLISHPVHTTPNDAPISPPICDNCKSDQSVVWAFDFTRMMGRVWGASEGGGQVEKDVYPTIRYIHLQRYIHIKSPYVDRKTRLDCKKWWSGRKRGETWDLRAISSRSIKMESIIWFFYGWQFFL